MGKKASGIAQIIVGAIIILYFLPSAFIWSVKVNYNDDGTIAEREEKLTGFAYGKLVAPLVVGGIIIYFGISTLRKKDEAVRENTNQQILNNNLKD